jgi:hypothetical protein
MNHTASSVSLIPMLTVGTVDYPRSETVMEKLRRLVGA